MNGSLLHTFILIISVPKELKKSHIFALKHPTVSNYKEFLTFSHHKNILSLLFMMMEMSVYNL